MSSGENQKLKGNYSHYSINNVNESRVCLTCNSKNTEENILIVNLSDNHRYCYSANAKTSYLYGDNIFFIDNNDNRMYKVNIRSHEITKISEKQVGMIVVNNGYIYYTEKPFYNLYKMNLDGSSSELMLEGYLTYEFEISDNKLYFVEYNTKNLYVMDLDTKEIKNIFNKKINVFTVQHNKIFYTKYSDFDEVDNIDNRIIYQLDTEAQGT